MERNLLNLAATVIQRSSRERPADEVLRSQLKTQRGLSQIRSAQVSRAVFTYYRWFGWLDQREPLEDQIDHALQLARKFAENPLEFSDDDLKNRVVPEWLSDEMEITPDWLRAIQAEPKVWLRARPGQGGALAAKLGDCKIFGADALQHILEYHGNKDLFKTAEFHAGEFELQDISSQAVGLICAPRPGQNVWDACAGEGGKALHLSDLMGNKGLIWATDRAEWRLQKLKRRAGRAHVFNYRTRLWNGEAKLPTKTLFDIVLVDAPCSGIGTWQRNPHARWTITPTDIRELGEVQLRLLIHAAAAAKPGGKVIYSACTLTRRETLEIAERFERGALFERLAITNPLVPLACASQEVILQPQQFGGNGMYVAGWTRSKK
jgi:16S rRNA (cytosine967-C5)-methyltransferase